MGYIEILNRADELSGIAELEKSSCKNDDLGTHCSSCKRRKTEKCFDPEKEKNHGWKWG